MTSITDRELQEKIENGFEESSDANARAYQLVFNTLKKEPSFRLSPSFSNNVLLKIDQVRERRAARRDYLWLGIGLFSFLVATVIVIVLTGFNFDIGAFTFLRSYGGLLIFGALVVGLIHLIEKELLNTKRVSH